VRLGSAKNSSGKLRIGIAGEAGPSPVHANLSAEHTGQCRAADDLEHVGGCGLLLSRLSKLPLRFGEFAGPLVELLFEIGRRGNAVALLAMELEGHLQGLGYTIVGPFGDLARATEACRREAIDVAVLDTNLNGEMVYPLADDLSAHGIPFIFVTGYSASNLPEGVSAPSIGFDAARRPGEPRPARALPPAHAERPDAVACENTHGRRHHQVRTASAMVPACGDQAARD
jgi:hypothetical protein